MDKEDISLAAGFILIPTAVILIIFGLCKLGSVMFDVGISPTDKPNASSTTDGETCWSKGGVPQYDTGGTSDDFKDCKFPEAK